MDKSWKLQASFSLSKTLTVFILVCSFFQFSVQFSVQLWWLGIEPLCLLRGFKAVRVSWWAVQCRLVVHGAGSLYFGLDSVDIKMSEMTWHKVVSQLWGVLDWFEASCVCLLLFGLKWVPQHRLHRVVHVPVCALMCHNVWAWIKTFGFLCVPLLTLPFGWLKELVLLKTCFCLSKITFPLEITSDFGLKCFLGIIILCGSDFLDNWFQRMLFSSWRAVITCFSLLSWCIIGERCS